jgi:hypothetical protein
MSDAREAIIVAQNSSTATATFLQNWTFDSEEIAIDTFLRVHAAIIDNAFKAAEVASAAATVTHAFGGAGAAAVTYGEGFPSNQAAPASFVPAPPAPPVVALIDFAQASDAGRAQAFLAGYTGNFPFLVDLKSKASRGLSEKQVASVLKCAARER